MSSITRYNLSSQERTKINRSKQRNKLLFQSGKVEYVNPGTETDKTITINHELGYTPAFTVFMSEDGENFRQIPYAYEADVPDPFTQIGFYKYRAYVTDTQLFINIDTDAFGITLYNPDATFRYFIYREKAR